MLSQSSVLVASNSNYWLLQDSPSTGMVLNWNFTGVRCQSHFDASRHHLPVASVSLTMAGLTGSWTFCRCVAGRASQISHPGDVRNSRQAITRRVVMPCGKAAEPVTGKPRHNTNTESQSRHCLRTVYFRKGSNCFNGFPHATFIHLMNFNRSTNAFQHGQCQSTSQMLTEFFHAREQFICFMQRWMIERQAKACQATENPVTDCGWQTMDQ